MKIVGLITEYNPFHKGHEYHIRRAKELTGADAVVVIMSGNYVQRGTPAYMDKYARTNIALNHGADVVVELPMPFACSSAEYFATASVTLLHKMGCIDYICFGSECEDISLLSDVADVLASAKIDPDHQLNKLIKEAVKTGTPYATARSNGLATILGDQCKDIVDKPNNILGIEYMKALKLLNSPIVPVSITRTNAGYHHSEENDAMYSASSLREAISSGNTVSSRILNELYDFDSYYESIIGSTAPVTEDDFSTILVNNILSYTMVPDACNTLTQYAGVDTDLANRISNPDMLCSFKSFSQFASILKTKNIAYTALSRALLALTLDIKKTDIDEYVDNGIASYVRLLGFKKNASAVLNAIKFNGNLTIIGQLSEVNDSLPLTDCDRRMIKQSIYYDELYNMIVRHKFATDVPSEYQRKIIIK